MDKIKNIHTRSILPFLLVLMLLFQMPASSVKGFRKACLYVCIPAQKVVGALAFFLPSQEELLSFYNFQKNKEKEASSRAAFSLQEEGSKHKSFSLGQLKPFAVEGVSAQVVFRQPRLGSHCVWINIGSSHNDQAGHALVAINSPVLSSGNLVGVVDEVLEKVSRVRLITDKQFTPSVKAARGGDALSYLLFKLSQDLDHLNRLGEEAQTAEIRALIAKVERGVLKGEKGVPLMGRGELEGSVDESLKTACLEVKGVAFNYEEESSSGMNRGDLLVTTGLDGVFYPGLPVAQVSFVDEEKRQEPFYPIRAQLLATDLFSLQHVTVLPSRNGQSF